MPAHSHRGVKVKVGDIQILSEGVSSELKVSCVRGRQAGLVLLDAK